MRRSLVCVLTGAVLAASMIGTVCLADEAKTFTVGFDAEYPPFGYMDEDGEYTGFDLELAQAVCDLQGWELVKTPIDWDSKDMELNSGAIDCIWNGFTMNGREDDYTWSVPYVDNSQVIVIPEDSDIADLAGLAGTQEGPGGFVSACLRLPRRAYALLAMTREEGASLRCPVPAITADYPSSPAFAFSVRMRRTLSLMRASVSVPSAAACRAASRSSGIRMRSQPASMASRAASPGV